MNMQEDIRGLFSPDLTIVTRECVSRHIGYDMMYRCELFEISTANQKGYSSKSGFSVATSRGSETTVTRKET